MFCEHTLFECDANIIRLVDVGRYVAEVRIKCATCGIPFRFIGLRCGVSETGPTVSVTGEELRAPIAPRPDVATILDGANTTELRRS